MTEFSDKLTQYMTAAHLTGKEICQNTGLSTSGFSRLKQGGKKVSLSHKQLNSLLDMMNLTDEQRREMMTLYDMREYSEYDRRCITAVKRMVSGSFSKRVPSIVTDISYDFINMECVEGTEKVRNVIFSAFSYSNSHPEESTVYISSDMKNDIFVQNVCDCLCMFKKVNAYHIFELLSSRNEGYYAYNIEAIVRLMPFLMECENYSVSFKYSDDEHESGAALASTLIFDDFTIEISPDMSKAKIYNKSSNHHRSKKENSVREYENCCNVNKSSRDDLFDFDFLRMESNMANYTVSNVMEFSPCIKLIIEQQDLYKLLENFPNSSELVDMVVSIRDSYVKSDASVNNFFSADGIRKIFEEGWYGEFNVINSKLPNEVILNLIKNMRTVIQSNSAIHYYMINDKFLYADPYFSFDLKNNGYALLFFGTNLKKPLRCLIREPSVYTASCIFFDYLKKSSFVASDDELLQLLDEYEQKLSVRGK